MTKIKGTNVILVKKTKNGTDPFGNPIFKDTEIQIKNVLIAPVSTKDMIDNLNLTGKTAKTRLEKKRRSLEPHSRCCRNKRANVRSAACPALTAESRSERTEIAHSACLTATLHERTQPGSEELIYCPFRLKLNLAPKN